MNPQGQGGEAGEWGTRRQGKQRRKGEAVYASSFPLFHSTSQRGGLHRLVQAQLSSLPLWGREIFIQMGAVVFTPPPISFHFEQGRLYSPPPVSFYFKRGWWYSRCPPFLSISNEDSVWHSRCPPIPFCCESHSLPPILFHFKWGRRESHTLPWFLFVCPL